MCSSCHVSQAYTVCVSCASQAYTVCVSCASQAYTMCVFHVLLRPILCACFFVCFSGL